MSWIDIWLHLTRGRILPSLYAQNTALFFQPFYKVSNFKYEKGFIVHYTEFLFYKRLIVYQISFLIFKRGHVKLPFKYFSISKNIILKEIAKTYFNLWCGEVR